jgi:hypothetical protein
MTSKEIIWSGHLNLTLNGKAMLGIQQQRQPKRAEKQKLLV